MWGCIAGHAPSGSTRNGDNSRHGRAFAIGACNGDYRAGKLAQIESVGYLANTLKTKINRAWMTLLKYRKPIADAFGIFI